MPEHHLEGHNSTKKSLTQVKSVSKTEKKAQEEAEESESEENDSENESDSKDKEQLQHNSTTGINQQLKTTVKVPQIKNESVQNKTVEAKIKPQVGAIYAAVINKYASYQPKNSVAQAPSLMEDNIATLKQLFGDVPGQEMAQEPKPAEVDSKAIIQRTLEAAKMEQ